jgi:salicylate hydroxylase
MAQQALIAGGGIGGLAAALACTRAGWDVRLFERAAAFSEVGAGIQMGPNVTRILQGWGLGEALAAVAATPERLRVRDALRGHELASIALGCSAVERYGAPYATLRRADLQQLLLAAVQAEAGVSLRTGTTFTTFSTDHSAENNRGTVTLATSAGPVEGDALIGADGLWSAVRAQLLRDGPAPPTGHLAYRAMRPQASLPAALRSGDVTVWLGPRLHVVTYPVLRGEWLNVVAIVHGRVPGDDLTGWDHAANASSLREALRGVCTPLADQVQAMADWRLWVLCDRSPVASPDQLAVGRVALLGDAAHPMRPYLAQGAGMAIEDAAELGRALAMTDIDVPLRLRRYALNRWQRNARVQARSARNGRIFHATGLVRWGRNASLVLLGERLLDLPWLYRGPATVE